MRKDDKQKVKQLYSQWEEACAREEEASLRMEAIQDELHKLGVNVYDPPDWIDEE